MAPCTAAESHAYCHHGRANVALLREAVADAASLAYKVTNDDVMSLLRRIDASSHSQEMSKDRFERTVKDWNQAINDRETPKEPEHVSGSEKFAPGGSTIDSAWEKANLKTQRELEAIEARQRQLVVEKEADEAKRAALVEVCCVVCHRLVSMACGGGISTGA